MEVIYFSKTNNVKKFCQKLELPVRLGTSDYITDEPFILLIYTTGFGEVPKEVEQFLGYQKNQQNLRAVCSSGNKNWGINYGVAADIIAEQYQVPLLMKFELSGNIHDVKKFTIKYQELVNNE